MPLMGDTEAEHKHHRPWYGDDVCALGWGVVGAQAMVWAKAADHHGASGITFSDFSKKYRISMVHFYLS